MNRPLNFQDVSTLFAWQQYYLEQTEGDREQSKANALYLLSSLYYHSENFHLLKLLFPVDSVCWERAKQQIRLESKRSLWDVLFSF